MNKVTIKGEVHNLKGELITKGKELIFKAKDVTNMVVDSSNFVGYKIISAFPDINTRICDLQTLQISEWAGKWTNVLFISITMDDIDVINKWCAAKGVDNIEIWSDKEFRDFGNKTNSIIPSIDKLARGFIVMKENTIMDIYYKDEVSEMPDFDSIEKIIKSLK